MAAMPTPEENRVRKGQEHYRSVTELMNAFEQNYLLELAEGTAIAGAEPSIVKLAQHCIKMQRNLRSEEERSIENALTFCLQSAEFEHLSAKERAQILAGKVGQIRQDYE